MIQVKRGKKLNLVILALLILPSCTFLSNRDYVERHSVYQGSQRMVIFLQRWPAYLQQPSQNDPGADFIKKNTLFCGPWEPAAQINPRAVDIQDIDDEQVGEIILEVMAKKGYQPFLSEIKPAAGLETVEGIMAKYQSLDPQVDAFLFCFYSPTLFFADAQRTPQDHRQRSFSLQEIVQILQPGGNSIIWAGPRAGRAPKNSISHAFIYLSISCFKALNWQPLWQVADSQAGGKLRPWVPQCPPSPTDRDYWADADMIRRLMCQNLSCRLRHLIPDSF